MTSSSRLEGDRYQHLYSWFEILALLDAGSKFDHAFVEQKKAGSVDDVTFHPKAGSRDPIRFVQIKWHVDHQAQYSFGELLKINPPSTRSLLKKTFDSWCKLRTSGDLEISLVSNWVAALDLGEFIVGRDQKLKNEFFQCTTRKLAKLHKELAAHLGSSDSDLHAFFNCLHLNLGFSSINALEERVSERMRSHNLRCDPEARTIGIDRVKEWIEIGKGKLKIDRSVLLDTIAKSNLWAAAAEEPKTAVWIHGWLKDSYGGNVTTEIDWTSYFDRDTRRIPSQDEWTNVLAPALKRLKSQLLAMPNAEGKFVDIRGKLSLTALLAIGHHLPCVGGFRLRWEQAGPKTELWDGSATASNLDLSVSEAELDPKNADTLFVLSITGDGMSDVLDFQHKSGLPVGRICNLTPSTGVGATALKSGSDAVALANSTKDNIKLYRNKYGGKAHLILYGPAGLALFLGQHLNALGPIRAYERTADGSYSLALCLETG